MNGDPGMRLFVTTADGHSVPVNGFDDVIELDDGDALSFDFSPIPDDPGQAAVEAAAGGGARTFTLSAAGFRLEFAGKVTTIMKPDGHLIALVSPVVDAVMEERAQ